MTAELSSARLSYRRLTPGDAGALHRLAVEPHVRRYLLDGEVVPPSGCEETIRASDALFDGPHGAGLFLVEERAAPGAVIGFCGFHVFPEIWPPPELIYAFTEAHTGRGLATEAGQALLELAFDVLGHEVVHSSVDAPNVASVRVLEKLGFRRIGDIPGDFGPILLFERRRAI